MDTFRCVLACGVALLLSACAGQDRRTPDARTAAWWATTAALSGDDMEGRDTGSPGYDRAAAYTAERFARAGLRPAGDAGTFFQQIRFDEVEIPAEAGTVFRVIRADGGERSLRFLHEIAVTPTWGMAGRIDAPLAFRGYCAPADLTEVRGAVVVCFGTRRTGQPTGAAQLEAATAAGAVALMRVDDPGFTIEPPRWPLAYARTVVLADTPKPPSIPVLRLAAPAFTELAAASGMDGEGILAHGARSAALAAFDFGARLDARIATRTRSTSAANVLAVLPGTDPTLAHEPVLLVAHLDGYGFGTPVDGDRLYNGALDDAAYVATLIHFAELRAGRGFRRPLVFAAVTAEEKGLLGSRWLAAHPTPEAPTPVAVLNLDQLRPLYPLRILTVLALDDSSLGETVRAVAEPMGIVVRADLEPERNLLRRTDHWPFMQIGVPAVSFLFGFDASDARAAAAYRDWYQHRYHAPQDDLTTPIDFQAQADFHRFYFALVEAVAEAATRPTWAADSPHRPQNVAP